MNGRSLDWGYGSSPRSVFRNGWLDPEPRPGDEITTPLIKLHGSTNWLTAHPVTDGKDKILTSHALSADAYAIYEHSEGPFACFAGRYRGGFQPFSYGYYPPNLEFPGRAAPEGHMIISMRPRVPWREEGEASDAGLPSIPLIIPPVKKKSYEFFGSLFSSLWKTAEDVLAQADDIVVIGYSFPATDIQSEILFRRAFSRRSSMPNVSILDPAPERAAQRFRDDLGIDDEHLRVEKDYFTSTYDIGRLHF